MAKTVDGRGAFFPLRATERTTSTMESINYKRGIGNTIITIITTRLTVKK
jgi:hypothetical protein